MPLTLLDARQAQNGGHSPSMGSSISGAGIAPRNLIWRWCRIQTDGLDRSLLSAGIPQPSALILLHPVSPRSARPYGRCPPFESIRPQGPGLPGCNARPADTAFSGPEPEFPLLFRYVRSVTTPAPVLLLIYTDSPNQSGAGNSGRLEEGRPTLANKILSKRLFSRRLPTDLPKDSAVKCADHAKLGLPIEKHLP